MVVGENTIAVRLRKNEVIPSNVEETIGYSYGI